MVRFLRTVLKPEIYHGAHKKPPFFEGWYFKVVDASGHHSFTFIPGVFLHQEQGQQHSFVQILEGNTGTSTYHRFPLENFSSADGRFEIVVGKNLFSRDRMLLDLDTDGPVTRGELRFVNTRPWPVTLRSPGIMGWYAWVPFMECNHGVLSLDHEIRGSLQINNRMIDFTGGRGYIEKDWGRCFPSAHIWMQSNHLGTSSISLTASVAIIPWIGSSFPGFIVGFLFQGKLYRFATYTGARISSLELTDTEVVWTMYDSDFELSLRAHRSHGGLLHAPTTQEMANRLLESLAASIEVVMRKRNGPTIFKGTGIHAGLEVGGKIEELVALWRSSKR